MPLTADAIAAQQVQERLKALIGIVQEIEKKRVVCENGVTALQKFQNSQDDKSGHYQVLIRKTNVILVSNNVCSRLN